MEWSYRITRSDVREGYWLNYWSLVRKIVVGLFAVVSLLMSVFIFTLIRVGVSSGLSMQDALTSDAVLNLLWLPGLFVVFIVMIFVVSPIWVIRKTFKNPAFQTEIRATVTAEGITVTAGELAVSDFQWSMYRSWREGKNVIVLRPYSPGYQIVSKSSLSEPEREELRRILRAALPDKK